MGMSDAVERAREREAVAVVRRAAGQARLSVGLNKYKCYNVQVLSENGHEHLPLSNQDKVLDLKFTYQNQSGLN